MKKKVKRDMVTEPLQSEKQSSVVPCRCGRVYTHCLACGQKKPYVKKKRSAELSFELGKRVWVFSCTNCPVETHTGMECEAPPVETGAGFRYVPFQKQEGLPPWGHAVPGTIEHGRLLSEWVVEKQAKKGWDRVRVYVEAQKAGWHLEAYPEIDEDVKQALVDQGLFPEEESPVTTDKGIHEVDVQKAEAITLDDIIKNMQEESK